MAIGTTAAIIGASVAGAGASVIGGNRAANAQEAATAAQVQASDQSTALNREIYYDQTERLEPFRQLGVSAINPLADLLGLDYQTGGTQGAQGGVPLGGNATAFPPQNGTGGYYGGGTRGYDPRERLQARGGFNTQAYFAANPDVANSYSPGAQGFNSADDYARAHWETHGQNEGRDLGIPTGRLAGIPGATGPNNQPHSGTGLPALTGQQRTTSALDALTQRPGYQFRLGQGNDAYEASAASRGMTMSGAQQRALAEYNQNYATGALDNEINRLLAVMGGGQVATNSQNQAAGSFGQLANQNAINAGNARASGYVNSANARNQGINGALGSIGEGVGAVGDYQGWF